MIQSIPAKDVQTGMNLVFGRVTYKITQTEYREDGKIQFHLSWLKLKASLLANSDDDLTVDA